MLSVFTEYVGASVMHTAKFFQACIQKLRKNKANFCPHQFRWAALEEAHRAAMQVPLYRTDLLWQREEGMYERRDKLDLQTTYLATTAIPMALFPLYKQPEKQKPLSETTVAGDYLPFPRRFPW